MEDARTRIRRSLEQGPSKRCSVRKADMRKVLKVADVAAAHQGSFKECKHAIDPDQTIINGYCFDCWNELQHAICAMNREVS